MFQKRVSPPLLVAALLGISIVVILVFTSQIFRSLFIALLIFCIISLLASNQYKLLKVGALVLCLVVGGIVAVKSPRPVAAENQIITALEIEVAPESVPPIESMPPEEYTISNCDLDPVWNEHPNITQWESLLESACSNTSINVNLLAAMMMQESGGDPNAYSTSGAVGLLQVMPRDGIAASAQCINGPCFSDRPTSQELYDPAFNVAYGSDFFLGKLNSRGNIYDALMAYNGGGDPDYAHKVLVYFNEHQTH